MECCKECGICFYLSILASFNDSLRCDKCITCQLTFFLIIIYHLIILSKSYFDSVKLRLKVFWVNILAKRPACLLIRFITIYCTLMVSVLKVLKYIIINMHWWSKNIMHKRLYVCQLVQENALICCKIKSPIVTF